MVINHPRVKPCGSRDEAELIIPPHPEFGVYPTWLRERALERAPELRDAYENSDYSAVNNLIEGIGRDWLDHEGTAVYAGKEYLISEPYDMNREKIDQLVRFCDALNLAFSVQASGHHYPTQTMRILVWPREWPGRDEFLQHVEAYEVREEFLAQDKWARECQAGAAEISRPPVSHLGAVPAGGPDDGESGFAQEEDLRDYLAGNLQLLEDGMVLWPVGKGQNAVEFPLGGARRIDILARDRIGVPAVIELKVSKGHEKVVGQVLYYRSRVKQLLKAERVRIVIVAKQIGDELRAAASELPDVSLFEYRLSMTLRRV